MKLSRKLFLGFFFVSLFLSFLFRNAGFRKFAFFQPGLNLIHKDRPEFPARAWVKKVIDGDTVILAGGRHLRYLGIDAPETRLKKQDQWLEIQQFYGKKAEDFNRQIVEKKKIYLEYDLVKQDQYDRLLAYVFVDGIFVNAKMVEQGLALIDTRPPNVKYTQLLFQKQREARKNGLGFWGDINKQIVSADEAGKFIGNFKMVEGKVNNIYESPQVIALNFGRNFKTDFSAVIFKDNLKLFTEQGINPINNYRNKKLYIVGTIREYNGPEIIINSPAQIEVVK